MNRTIVEYSNNPASTGTTYHIGRPLSKREERQLGGESFSTEERYAYNNNLITEKKKRGNGTEWLTETYGHDQYGNVTSKAISASGVATRTESYKFDDISNRFMESSTDIEGLVTNFKYDQDNGNLLFQTNPYGLTTGFLYDGWDRMKYKTDYLDNQTAYYYGYLNDGGVQIEVARPGESNERTTYNTFGWKVKTSVTSLNGQWVSKYFEHDVAGRKIRESEPTFSTASQWNRVFYDGDGRMESQTLYTGKVIRISYDGLSSTVDDGTKSVTTTKDPMGNTVRLQDPGGTINYTYFANGAMKEADYGGHKVITEIDGWGRKTRLNDPSAGDYKYIHNIYGELLEEQTPKGTTGYEYDNFGKVTKKTVQGDETYLTLDYSYEPDTKLLSSAYGSDNINNRSYTYNYGYDDYERLESIAELRDLTNFSKEYKYDGYGRVQNEVYTTNLSNGIGSTVRVRNEYDALSGVLKAIYNDNGQGERLWKLSSVNARGQALSIQYGENKFTSTRTYDSYGFPKSIKDEEHDSGGAMAIDLEYSFNPQRGTLTSRGNNDLDWEESFGYDKDRLTTISGSTSKTMDYDPFGRIKSNTDAGSYSYQGGNRYRLDEIDPNVQGTSHYPGHSSQQITYNAFKKPVEINEEGHGRASFEYGPLMNRTHAYYGGAETNREERRYHKHYSSIMPVEIIEDADGANAKIITYIAGDAYSAPVAHIKQTGAGALDRFHYLHRDYLGSILAISDDLGTTREKRQFGAWGTVDKWMVGTYDSKSLAGFGGGLLSGRGYTGHEHFFDIGLIHMNGRMYDAMLGRFLSPDNFIQDPFNTQNFNRYGYVLNNPLSFADPSGEFIITAGIIIGAAVIGGYAGGSIANSNWNPLEWDWGSGRTWTGIVGGAAVGVVSAVAGAAVASTLAVYEVSALVSTAIGGVGGMIQGGGFAVLPGGGGDVLGGMLTGALSGFVGGAAGHLAAQHISNVAINGINLSGPAVKGAIGGLAGGTVGGYASGFTAGFIQTGDLSLANKAAMKSAFMGAAVGTVMGTIGGYNYAKQNGMDPWSGKFEDSFMIGEGMTDRVNPVAKDLKARTIGDFPSNSPAYLDKGLRLGPTPEGLRYNSNYIQNEVNLGTPIYDIGPRGFQINSSFYNLEVGRTYNYFNLHQVNYRGYYPNSLGEPRIRITTF